jgi:hypothetical protein
MPGSISPSSTLESGQIPGMPTKKPTRTELEQKRDEDIVRAAIEAASKQHPQTAQKRSHSTFCNDVDQTSAPTIPGAKKKPNAFSKMMKGGTAKEEYQPGFEQWFEYLEKALAEKEARLSHYPSETEWASVEWANAVTDTIIESVKRKIQWSIYRASFFRAKINALHALIEIASGVAYAPKSKASDLIRNGRLPKFLIESMYNIALLMSDSDISQTAAEEAFLGKVKDLRHNPQVPWEGDTWNGLDDVLRVLKDFGPVDFRMIFTSFKELHDTGRTTHDIIGRYILDSIRKEISNYVDQGTCFDTMYNAMNVLVDIGIALLERPMYCLHNPRVVSEALGTALLKIGKMLKDEGIVKMVAELRSESEARGGEIDDVIRERLSPTCLNDFQNRMETQSKTDKFYHDLSKLQRYLDKDKYLKTYQQERKSLLIKILYLRWKSNHDKEWTTCHNNLDQLLDLFVDTTVPLECNEFLPKLESLVETYLYPNRSYQPINYEEREPTIRSTIHGCIAQMLRRAAGRACVETRLNSWKELVKFGLRILEWTVSFPWFAEILNDHQTENYLTNAMLNICYSLMKSYGLNFLSEHKILDDVKELDNRRRKIRGAMPELDAVLKAIHHPEKMRSKESQKATKGMVIDLTKE